MGLTSKKVYAILNGKIKKISEEIAGQGTAIVYKGSVATEDDLPQNPSEGDMYNIESESTYGEAGMNVAWTGEKWDTMGATIDLSTLKAPNPHILRFTGAVSGEYDGSYDVEIEIPNPSNATLKVDNHIMKIE